MNTLPIHEVLDELKKALLHHNRLVLQAPPGAGKTTALPLALLDEPWLEDKKIIMLEPRRLAVRSSAARMAEMLGEEVGERIGYQIKMDSVQSEKTKILIVTEGILTRKLQADPSLEEFALIIFDEFHERSIHADLSLALSLESQALLRDDLKLLVMSATLNTSAISQLLANAPLIESQGRAYPVESVYLDAKTPQPSKEELPLFIYKLLREILDKEEGNILVFLPGVREIKQLEAKLQQSDLKNTYVSSLFGSLSKQEQDKAIKAPKKGVRKIVLSTNIAQTSLTIEGIRIVIDSGLSNASVFDASSGMNRLVSRFISQDSAVQRAGRAGRTSEGKAYHIWHKAKGLIKHDTPEILEADLIQLQLELAVWGNEDIDELSWMDRPPEHALTHAKELLSRLGALDARGKITEHGEQMSRFGLHPRLAHMMIRAREMGLAYEASLLAVLISEKDVYRDRTLSTDMRERVGILHGIKQNEGYKGSGVNLQHCRSLLQNARRLEAKPKEHIDMEKIGILLAFAYPERIAQIRDAKSTSYLLANGKGAFIHKEDALVRSEFLVVSDLDGRAESALIYRACALSRAQIEEDLSDLTEERELLRWNAQEQRVEARKVRDLGAIRLQEQTMPIPKDAESAGVLIEAIRETGSKVLPWSKKSSAFVARVNFVNTHQRDHFPDLSEETLLAQLDEWLLPYIREKNSFKSLQDLDLYGILSAMLTWEQMQELERLAPEKVTVASGSNISIDYTDACNPVLAVRLQEMFGTQRTPAVLDGKVKLMIHLLSPAHRPMQMTRDLESFWKNTYDEVKKELRGKYKKHYWPDDPLEAIATAKTKKNMVRK